MLREDPFLKADFVIILDFIFFWAAFYSLFLTNRRIRRNRRNRIVAFVFIFFPARTSF